MPLKDCPHPLCHRENDELEKSHATLLAAASFVCKKLNSPSDQLDWTEIQHLRSTLGRAIAQAEKVQHDLSILP